MTTYILYLYDETKKNAHKFMYNANEFEQKRTLEEVSNCNYVYISQRKSVHGKFYVTLLEIGRIENGKLIKQSN